MPFHIADLKQEVKTISKVFKGGQTLTLSYRPHAYTSQEQADFEDSLSLVSKVCPNPECGARLPLEELTETERAQVEEGKKKKGGAYTNGHAMFERTLVCTQCNTKVQPSKRVNDLMSGYLADILTEVDWDDEDGPIPIQKEAIQTRVLPNVLLFVFEMIGEDRSGKGSRAK